MGYVKVKFLREEYEVSETINEFLEYDKLLTPIMKKLLDRISLDITHDSKRPAGDFIDDMDSKIDAYKRIMTEGADLLVKQLLNKGVYDVTANDLLRDDTSFSDLDKLATTIGMKLCSEGQKFVDMKNAGMERAYSYAASNITGSGVRIFTSSLSMLMIHSAVEKSIMMSQAKKADKEYEDAVRAINAKIGSGFDRMCNSIMINEYYPILANILLQYVSNVSSAFLVELTTHDKFDFESVQSYNMQKAEEMLKNINQVPDKIEFLKQAFLICPFSLEVYEECVKYGLLDKETFETAKYFGFADELAEKIDEEIKTNLKNTEKIIPLISILALYRNTNEIEIWKEIYAGTLGNIEGTYKKINRALLDKRKLDEFIRENICNQMQELVKKSKDDIVKSINKVVQALVSEKQFNEFVKMGVISPETIRLPGSAAITLGDINREIIVALVDCVMEYSKEAKQRLDAYNVAMNVYEKELKQKDEELSSLKSEKSKLGLFAFSKKKELTAIIASKTNEILEFKRTHEPTDLLSQFESMYR